MDDGLDGLEKGGRGGEGKNKEATAANGTSSFYVRVKGWLKALSGASGK